MLEGNTVRKPNSKICQNTKHNLGLGSFQQQLQGRALKTSGSTSGSLGEALFLREIQLYREGIVLLRDIAVKGKKETKWEKLKVLQNKTPVFQQYHK